MCPKQILSQIVCVAELASHDAATTTQVIYSATSVAERILGPFVVAERFTVCIFSSCFGNYPEIQSWAIAIAITL
jgi:hypothetical protein